MEAIRKIASAGTLAPIIDLPWKAKDMKVEETVMPFDFERTGITFVPESEMP